MWPQTSSLKFALPSVNDLIHDEEDSFHVVQQTPSLHIFPAESEQRLAMSKPSLPDHHNFLWTLFERIYDATSTTFIINLLMACTE